MDLRARVHGRTGDRRVRATRLVCHPHATVSRWRSSSTLCWCSRGRNGHDDPAPRFDRLLRGEPAAEGELPGRQRATGTRSPRSSAGRSWPPGHRSPLKNGRLLSAVGDRQRARPPRRRWSSSAAPAPTAAGRRSTRPSGRRGRRRAHRGLRRRGRRRRARSAVRATRPRPPCAGAATRSRRRSPGGTPRRRPPRHSRRPPWRPRSSTYDRGLEPDVVGRAAPDHRLQPGELQRAAGGEQVADVVDGQPHDLEAATQRSGRAAPRAPGTPTRHARRRAGRRAGATTSASSIGVPGRVEARRGPPAAAPRRCRRQGLSGSSGSSVMSHSGKRCVVARTRPGHA